MGAFRSQGAAQAPAGAGTADSRGGGSGIEDTAAEAELVRLLHLASDHLAAGDVEEALSELERAVALRPKDAKARGLLALCCFKLGMLDRAERIYLELARENPFDITLHVNLGLVQLKAGKHEAAIRSLGVATGLAPEHRRAQNYLGLAFAQSGNYEKAREAFVRAGSAAKAREMERALASGMTQEDPPPKRRVPTEPFLQVPGFVEGGEAPPSASHVAGGEGGQAPPGQATPSAQTPPLGTAAALGGVQPAAAGGGGETGALAPAAGDGSRPEEAAASPGGSLQPGEGGVGAKQPHGAAAAPPASDAPAAVPGEARSGGEAGASTRLSGEGSRGGVASIRPEVPTLGSTGAPAQGQAAPGGGEDRAAGGEGAETRDADLEERAAQEERSAAALPDAKPSEEASADPDQAEAEVPTMAELTRENRLFWPRGAPFAIEGSVCAIDFSDGIHTRVDGLIAARGDTSWRGMSKRFGGRLIDRSFGSGGRQMWHATGGGQLLIAAKHGGVERVFTSVRLEEDAYVVEDRLYAFEESVDAENGRVPGDELDLPLVRLRGDGHVLLVTTRTLRSEPIFGNESLRVPLDGLVGWSGPLTPRLIPMFRGAEGAWVELTGEGDVLLLS